MKYDETEKGDKTKEYQIAHAVPHHLKNTSAPLKRWEKPKKKKKEMKKKDSNIFNISSLSLMLIIYVVWAFSMIIFYLFTTPHSPASQFFKGFVDKKAASNFWSLVSKGISTERMRRPHHPSLPPVVSFFLLPLFFDLSHYCYLLWRRGKKRHEIFIGNNPNWDFSLLTLWISGWNAGWPLRGLKDVGCAFRRDLCL